MDSKFQNTCMQLSIYINSSQLICEKFGRQLVVASLLQCNIKSHLILRDLEKAKALFDEQDEEKLQLPKTPKSD
ncbi:hypothetical protein MTR_8g010710 [Medicago truncatula]|uniref:Uncharacterized protein n=1 Tax=Medicago truncatula TaxID=3880 RepID=A0A072TX20_MEDTR|nr:hypothetical protein MTR_8g010710 [Medicago truncatula]